TLVVLENICAARSADGAVGCVASPYIFTLSDVAGSSRVARKSAIALPTEPAAAHCSTAGATTRDAGGSRAAATGGAARADTGWRFGWRARTRRHRGADAEDADRRDEK